MKTTLHSFGCAICLLALAVLSSGCSAEARKERALQRGEKFFQAGEYEKAKIEFISVLREHNEDPLSVRRLGDMWFHQGAALRAAAIYMSYREIAPDDVDAHGKLAYCLLSLGQIDKAREEAIAVLDKPSAQEEAVLVFAETARSEEVAAQTVARLESLAETGGAPVRLGLALIAFRQRQLDTAQTRLEEALKLDPRYAPAYAALGRLFLARRDLTNALLAFDKAVEVAPPRSILRINQAELLAQTGQPEKAKELLTGLTKRVPDYIPGWNALARMYVSEQKNAEALSALDRVFAVDFDHIESRLLQNELLLKTGDAAKAVTFMETVERRFPNVPLVQLQLARSYMASANVPLASAALNRALSLNADYLEAAILMSEIHMRDGKPREAILLMQSFLERNPDSIGAQLVLAAAHQANKNLPEAAKQLQEILKLDGRNSRALFMTGSILRELGRYEDARRAFDAAMKVMPNRLLPLVQIVELYLLDKKPAAAHVVVAEEMARDPKQAVPYYLDGLIYSSEQAWPSAEAALKKAIELDPAFTKAYDLLISGYMAAGKAEAALAQAEALVAAQPDNSQAVLMTALISEQLGNYEKARDSYEKVITMTDSPAAMNNLAYMYSEKWPNPERALELARRARAIAPGDAAAADTLGWLLYKKGDYRDALGLLNEAAAAYPNNGEVLYHAAMAHYSSGQLDSARSLMERALADPSEFKGKEDATKRVALLKEVSGGAQTLQLADLEAMRAAEPKDVVVLLRLASLAEREGQFEKAASALDASLEVNPQLLPALTSLARLCSGPLKQAERAVTLAKRAKDLAPADNLVTAILGEAALSAGNTTWAFSLLSESAPLLREDARIQRDWGWAAYSVGRLAQARTAMELAAKSPDTAIAAEAAGFLELTAPPPDDAARERLVASAKSVLQAQPDHVPALMLAAAASQAEGDAASAIAIYERVLAKYPDFIPALPKLAALLFKDPAQLSKADELARKARKALPDDADLARLLAEISYQRKDYRYALTLLTENARRMPPTPRELFLAGICRQQTKDTEGARKDLQAALDAGLPAPDSDEARKALEQLPPPPQ